MGYAQARGQSEGSTSIGWCTERAEVWCRRTRVGQRLGKTYRVTWSVGNVSSTSPRLSLDAAAALASRKVHLLATLLSESLSGQVSR